ncbi:MAG: hypothetical protein ACI4JA_02345 [Oscillospiraceae bacterium]
MKKLKISDNPLFAAVVYILIWTAAGAGIFYYTTEVTTSLMPFILGFLFVYPIGTLVAAFQYAKRHGIKWYYLLTVTTVTVAEYFLFGFDSVEPNYIVMTAIAMFFGSGIGSQFRQTK